MFYRSVTETADEFNTLLELCQEQHRRIILAVLATEKRPLTVNELTKAIVKHNHHTPVIELSEDESRQIRTSLYHMHIPKLEELSLIEYDQERQLVESTSQFDQLQPQLSAIIDADPELEAPVGL